LYVPCYVSSKLKTRKNGATSEHCNVSSGSTKIRRMSLLPEDLVAYEAERRSMELVSLEMQLSWVLVHLKVECCVYLRKNNMRNVYHLRSTYKFFYIYSLSAVHVNVHT
jgi:hypothetical protein